MTFTCPFYQFYTCQWPPKEQFQGWKKKIWKKKISISFCFFSIYFSFSGSFCDSFGVENVQFLFNSRRMLGTSSVGTQAPGCWPRSRWRSIFGCAAGTLYHPCPVFSLLQFPECHHRVIRHRTRSWHTWPGYSWWSCRRLTKRWSLWNRSLSDSLLSGEVWSGSWLRWAV